MVHDADPLFLPGLPTARWVRSRWFKRLCLLLAAMVLIAAWFALLDYRKLFNSSEGRYAEIPREMLVSGDWITPRLNGIKYLEKPPLQYWATTAAYRLLEIDHWTARLWPALTGLFGLLLTGWLGTRLFGRTAGLCAALVLTSSIYYIVFSHIATLDMGVGFFLTLALAGLLMSGTRAPHAPHARAWMMLAWAAMALAVLSKGLIGVILPVLAVLAYALIERDWGIWRRLRLGSGLVLFVLVAAPWFVLVSIRNPEFAHFFFIEEHLRRFATGAAHRPGPIWYFIPILSVAVLPWLGVLPAALHSAWSAPAADRNRQLVNPTRLLLAWSLAIFIFFSLSSSKLPGYVVPALPPLALLIGRTLAGLDSRAVLNRIAPFALLSVGLFLLTAYWLKRSPDTVDVMLMRGLCSRWIRWAAFAAGLGLVGFLLFRKQRLIALASLAFGHLMAAQLALGGSETLAPLNSGWALAKQLEPYLADSTPFFSVNVYNQSLTFYSGRTSTMVQHVDEMEFGLRQEPELRIASLPEFVERWQGLSRGVAIMRPQDFDELLQSGVPMLLIGGDRKSRLVSRSAP